MLKRRPACQTWSNCGAWRRWSWSCGRGGRSWAPMVRYARCRWPSATGWSWPIAAYDDPPAALARVDLADDQVLIPGLVDTHVHINEPGRTEWEGFATATRAAAAGGVTTLVDMPLNSIPATTTVAALEVKQAAARGKVHVDVAFWGGIVPGNLADLAGLHARRRRGLQGLPRALRRRRVPPSQLCRAGRCAPDGAALGRTHRRARGGSRRHRNSDATARHQVCATSWRAARPQAEDQAITRLVELARASPRPGARPAPVLRERACLPLAAARATKACGVSAETCPHYLTLAAEDVPDAATAYKCCPPIRDRANQDALWQGMRDGVIDQVVSDHSPCTADLKASGDFAVAWGGIASLQLGLPLVWTAARARGFALTDVVRWMAHAPARSDPAAQGTDRRRRDADLVAFAPDETFTVDAAGCTTATP